jgi:predicted nucleic acid-binding protein
VVTEPQAAFVLDNSISLSWCLGDESDEYPTRVLLALRTTRARVPSLWPYEVANGLAVSERRNRLTPAGLQRALADLAALPIEVDPASHERGMGEVLALARQERLTAYDAAYLELAMREGLPIATLDQEIRAAAGRLGVELFDP